MNKLTALFNKEKEEKLLSIYFTAGFPNIDDTNVILEELQHNGVDFVEIGMPFSDPLADGPTIQASGLQALKNGMTIKKLFKQLRARKDTITIPIVLMGYLNPVLQYGMEDFLKDCKETGVSGVILPDLPLSVYEERYQDLFTKYDITNTMLVTPETSDKRLEEINRLCSGFIYAVSSSSTTGTDKNWTAQENYFKKLKDYNFKQPVITGFGVKDKASFDAASKYTNGAIIGTAFIKAIQQKGNLKESIADFIKQIKS